MPPFERTDAPAPSLCDIDLILNRALVYIPLTGILGGLYAAGVALFQRLFVAITGDRSDGAVVITTLVLAGMFTPIKSRRSTTISTSRAGVGLPSNTPEPTRPHSRCMKEPPIVRRRVGPAVSRTPRSWL